jgi:hypothetical protein
MQTIAFAGRLERCIIDILSQKFFNTVSLDETKRNQSMASLTFRESILLVVK